MTETTLNENDLPQAWQEVLKLAQAALDAAPAPLKEQVEQLRVSLKERFEQIKQQAHEKEPSFDELKEMLRTTFVEEISLPPDIDLELAHVISEWKKALEEIIDLTVDVAVTYGQAQGILAAARSMDLPPEDLAKIEQSVERARQHFEEQLPALLQKWLIPTREWLKRQANLPAVPDAFRDGVAKLPHNPAMTAVMQAIFKGGPLAAKLIAGWRASPTGNPVFEHLGKKGGRILVYPSIETRPTDPLPTAETLWRFVESLNPFTADVALAVLAQMVEPSTGDRPKYPLLEPVIITADAILSYKGIQRWGMERRMLEARVAEEMERLRHLRFDVERWPEHDPVTGKAVKDGASWKGDGLFDIVKVERWQEGLFDGQRQRIDIAWSVRAGQWAYWWLNAQGRVWLARMSRVLLELDHRQNRPAAVLAKKVGWYLSTVASRSQTFYIQISRLLEDIGELPVQEARDKHWAGRKREQFDEAMLTLRDAGVLQTVEWPDGCGPEDTDRSKGWVERWLNAHISGTLPEAAPELPTRKQALLPRRRRQHKEPAPEQVQIAGSAIRKARIERNWSQEELARHLGISRTYLSQLEAGKRLPSRELARKVNEWLAE